ncbi:MAG TPA: MOSC domain-containing protein [Kofleriaceae bacterium]|nr:MOSC domain-containing protein [Kofleriaceae bacterium]
MTAARIVQLAASKGGVPKLAIRRARATTLGLDVDKQKHLKIHGGPERALCLFSLDVLQLLQAEGHPIFPGSVGENVLIGGLDWAQLRPGVRIAFGDDVVVELTRTATPCKTIAESFTDGDYKRLERPDQMRWYSRVITEGDLRVAMPVRLLGMATPVAT